MADDEDAGALSDVDEDPLPPPPPSSSSTTSKPPPPSQPHNADAAQHNQRLLDLTAELEEERRLHRAAEDALAASETRLSRLKAFAQDDLAALQAEAATASSMLASGLDRISAKASPSTPPAPLPTSTKYSAGLPALAYGVLATPAMADDEDAGALSDVHEDLLPPPTPSTTSKPPPASAPQPHPHHTDTAHHQRLLDLTAELDEERRLLDIVDDLLVQIDAARRDRDEQMDRRNYQISELEAAVATRVAESESLSKSLSDREAEIIELQHIVEAQRAESGLLRTRMERQEKEIGQLQKQIKHLKAKERMPNDSDIVGGLSGGDPAIQEVEYKGANEAGRESESFILVQNVTLTMQARKKVAEKVQAIRCEYPIFVKVIAARNLARMEFAMKYAKVYLPELDKQMFLQVEGKSKRWDTKLKVYGHGTIRLRYEIQRDGWKEFVADNHVEVGDICLFELVKRSSTSVTMTVHLIRRSEIDI